MSVQVLPPPVSFPPLEMANGMNGASFENIDEDALIANGASDAGAGQQLIPNMIYPPPDMRSEFSSRLISPSEAADAHT